MPSRTFAQSGPRVYFVHLYRSSAQTLTSGNTDPVLWDTALSNFGNMWSPGDPAKVYIPFRGIWDLTGVVRYDTASATGLRQTFFRRTRQGATKNFFLSDFPGSTATQVTPPISGSMELVQGDTIELIPFQNSGGNLSINNFAFLAPIMTVALRTKL